MFSIFNSNISEGNFGQHVLSESKKMKNTLTADMMQKPLSDRVPFNSTANIRLGGCRGTPSLRKKVMGSNGK